MDYQKKYMKYKKKYLRLIGKLTGGMDLGPGPGPVPAPASAPVPTLVGPEAGQARPAVDMADLKTKLETMLSYTTPEGGVWDYDPNKTLINGVDEILKLENDGDIKYLIFKNGIWQKLLMPLDYSGTNNEAVEADAKHDYVTHLNQIKKNLVEEPTISDFMKNFAGTPEYVQEFKEFIDKKKSDQDVEKLKKEDVEKLKKEIIDKKKIECSQYSPAFNKLRQEYIGKSTVNEKDTLNRQLAKKTGKYRVGINTPNLGAVMKDVEEFFKPITNLAIDHGHERKAVEHGIVDSNHGVLPATDALTYSHHQFHSYTNQMRHFTPLLGLFDQNKQVDYTELPQEQQRLVALGTSIKISKYPLEDGGFLISVIQTRIIPGNKVKNFRYLIKIYNGLITSCGKYEGGGIISEILKDENIMKKKKNSC